MVPTTTVEVENVDGARKVLRLIDLLEDLDDVQVVHANYDIPDDVLEKVEV
jgi:transcriptional/translational regulatory protein YebC/TACO1